MNNRRNQATGLRGRVKRALANLWLRHDSPLMLAITADLCRIIDLGAPRCVEPVRRRMAPGRALSRTATEMNG